MNGGKTHTVEYLEARVKELEDENLELKFQNELIRRYLSAYRVRIENSAAIANAALLTELSEER